jgi:hypothetical protein
MTDPIKNTTPPTQGTQNIQQPVQTSFLRCSSKFVCITIGAVGGALVGLFGTLFIITDFNSKWFSEDFRTSLVGKAPYVILASAGGGAAIGNTLENRISSQKNKIL